MSKQGSDYIDGFVDGKLDGVNHVVRILEKILSNKNSDMEAIIEIKAVIQKIKESV